MSPLHEPITVVICTRNRPQTIIGAIDAIRTGSHQAFTLVVVDQSTNTVTQSLVKRLQGDDRIQYIHTSSIGVSAARNIALQHCTDDIVAFTDDDCQPEADW